MSKEIDRIRGPYTQKNGRKTVMIVYKDKSKRTVSYPKYLRELELGKELDPVKETTQHKDGNFNNNLPDNLETLPLDVHAAIDKKRAKLVKVNCIWCGVECFKKARRLTSNSKQGKAGPFCGYSCVAKYRCAKRYGKISTLPPQPSVPIEDREYFRLRDELP